MTDESLVTNLIAELNNTNTTGGDSPKERSPVLTNASSNTPKGASTSSGKSGESGKSATSSMTPSFWWTALLHIKDVVILGVVLAFGPILARNIPASYTANPLQNMCNRVLIGLVMYASLRCMLSN